VKAWNKRGFTLIELMVALVVAGVLMATLVGISGSVQRSFGRSKDIIELQANLRFAMHSLVDDFSRAAYMYSPNPDNQTLPPKDRRTVGLLPLPAEEMAAVAFDNATDKFTLLGNYVSSRDYRWNLDDSVIRSRNGLLAGPPGSGAELLSGFGDANDMAFERDFNDVFCPGVLVRLDRGDSYSYHTVATAAAGNYGITLNPNPDRGGKVLGSERWINPITPVGYQMVQDPIYQSPYTGGVLEAQRWVLNRTSRECRNGVATDVVTEVVDFLMPPTSASPGFVISPYYDESVSGEADKICGKAYMPDVSVPPRAISGVNPIDPVRIRAVVIVLRGRGEMEDPGLTVYHPDHSVDLDGNLLNGLAPVRTQRTVVKMRNIGHSFCVM
jgi:prepilin-type N-terminal cleavage/methylation domain-containing protein